MLLTNCKQTLLQKVEQCSTLQLPIFDIQFTEDSHHSQEKTNLNELAQQNEILRNVRQMEDRIFEESIQVFKILNESDTLIVDGLTYKEINQSQSLNKTLHLIKGNAPIYQHLNKRNKTQLMNKITISYMQKLNVNQTLDALNQADEQKNQSQNQSNTINLSSSAKFEKCNILKRKPLRKPFKHQDNASFNIKIKKKVRISNISYCKYFCSLQAPKKIKQRQVNSMQTF